MKNPFAGKPRSAPARRPRHDEHDAQVALFRRAALHEKTYPELRTLFAVPNAARRSPRQGAWMKAEGMKAGVPDVWLPAPRGNCPGLVIEMKAGKNKQTPEQVEWFALLELYGWKTAVCYSADEAWSAIVAHLDGAVYS